jgi:hypothetical protein
VNPNNTQSIIVYRNPVEAIFWQSGIAVPLGTSLLIFGILVYALGTVAEKISRGRSATLSYLAVGISFFVAAAVFWKLSLLA